MLTNGNISQPCDVSRHECQYFPERWLYNGMPYEFTTEATEAPPAELLSQFRLLTNANPVLGLYCTRCQRPTEDSVLLERTEGRCNITDFVASQRSLLSVSRKPLIHGLPLLSERRCWLPPRLRRQTLQARRIHTRTSRLVLSCKQDVIPNRQGGTELLCIIGLCSAKQGVPV